MEKLIERYFDMIRRVEAKKTEAVAGECLFIDNDTILDFGKDFGNSRYPYSADGLTLWANSSGNITVEEGAVHICPDTTEGREPRIAFFLGEAQGEEFFPVSLTGTALQLYENDVKRYVVYTPYACYYLCETADTECALRLFVDGKKNIRFSLLAKNRSGVEKKIYLSAYFNLLLQISLSEAESKWYKKSVLREDGFRLSVVEHVNRNLCYERSAAILRSETTGTVRSTTSHADYCGGYNRQLTSSLPLKRGAFSAPKDKTVFSETGIAGDLVSFTLKDKEVARLSYTLSIGENAEKGVRVTDCEIDEILKEIEGNAAGRYRSIPSFTLSGLAGADDFQTNCFLNNVFRQVEFCARAKNYAGQFVGIRDIFQQIEASLMWIPDLSRRKILDALNYIGEDGRAPRQFSYADSSAAPPPMDLRMYVDQGEWIITTVYQYLCFTNDLSLLGEKCGYYKFLKNRAEFSDKRDTVLDHLVKITEFLLSATDEKTHCLRALYGDWNDALDGLGRTDKAGREFGNGVSVMASLHLYRNLFEMCEILALAGGDLGRIGKYRKIRESLKDGLLRYAIVSKDGARKILHGWGDDRSFLVGSFCDKDNVSRDSLTSNAFWILSGMPDNDGSILSDIFAAYARLDSKYGYKTFEPYFDKRYEEVGRIVKLPKGTAENGATYVHATLFAIWSLFECGEGKLAWEQIYKILPIFHKFVSTSPFVMPNSYIYNEEENLDGESMSDWFTGSGCVLVKVLVRCIFGVRPETGNRIVISPAAYAPFERFSVSLRVKGKNIQVKYKKTGGGERSFKVNGVEAERAYCEKRKAYYIELEAKDCVVEIFD